MSDEYGVKKIISHFVDVDGKVKYEVEWENFPGENTFEPEENLEHSQDLLQKYRESIVSNTVDMFANVRLVEEILEGGITRVIFIDLKKPVSKRR